MALTLFKKKALSVVPSPPSGWTTILEPFTGAWQRNIEWKRDSVLASFAAFSCTTLIASDIAKLPINYVRKSQDGIWVEVPLGERYQVLKKPNPYQNRIQFFESWVNSKLTRGNTYVYKTRDQNGVVVRLDVLHPDLVLPLVTETGEVYYQVGQDNLSSVLELSRIVPASEIIHDRFNCLFHPLVGLSPLFASGLSAFNTLKIQENSSRFFENMSRPSGILSAPGSISNETADRLKEKWEENYGGNNIGRVAVLGDDLKYIPLAMTAEESQMVEQLRLGAEQVCATYHVPAYKVIGNAPSYNNVEALEQAYYSQCLQRHIEDIELCLDEGLRAEENTGFEMDLSVLLRMDSQTQVETLVAAVKGGIDTPNEARKQRNRAPLPGGDTVWLQQQEWPMEILANRRSPDDTETATTDVPQVEDDTDTEERALLSFAIMLRKELIGGEQA
jgi:HK97 family phage portal protein